MRRTSDWWVVGYAIACFAVGIFLLAMIPRLVEWWG
jgi:hypothetical protein